MRVLTLIVLGVTASLCLGVDPKPFPGATIIWNGFPKYAFPIDGAVATVVVPTKPLAGRPWVWRGEFFGAFAEADIALVREGWHLVYLGIWSVGHSGHWSANNPINDQMTKCPDDQIHASEGMLHTERAQCASGSGRIWNFTSEPRVPLPPSRCHIRLLP